MAPGEDWTRSEIHSCLDLYFEMLLLELHGLPFTKTEVNRRAQARLDRSKGSIELKWCNVSEALVRVDLPYVEGYKPLPHIQDLLVEEVSAYLTEHPRLHLTMLAYRQQ